MSGPGLAPWHDAVVTPARLEKAMRMRVQGDRQLAQFIVSSPSGEDHWVTLAARDADCPPCDCGDHAFRETKCAHVIAALLFVGDAHTVAMLGSHIRGAWLERRLYLNITKREHA